MTLSVSPREIQVLQLLAGGASNKQIARELQLSLHTVKRHVARTIFKLHVSSRAQAACLYRRSMQAAAPQPAAPRELTARERDVLELIARGASNLQIASGLGLSLNTVKRHAA